MPTFTVVVGKGGSGKSTISRYLSHRAKSRNTQLALFDADASNGTLTRYYKDAIRTPAGSDTVLQKFFVETVWPALETSSVVMDLGSGAERVFASWARFGLVEVAKEAGVDVVIIAALDHSKDALSPAHATFSATPGAKHVLVLNQGRAPEGEDFGTIRGHRVFAELTAGGAAVVDMPPLFQSMSKIDAHNFTFADAVAGAPIDGTARLGPFERQYVVHWLRQMDEALQGVPL